MAVPQGLGGGAQTLSSKKGETAMRKRYTKRGSFGKASRKERRTRQAAKARELQLVLDPEEVVVCERAAEPGDELGGLAGGAGRGTGALIDGKWRL